MKIQFLLVGVLCAVAEGQHFGDHVPVIKDGVPVDTPEVQAAKAAHFEAYERARVLAERKPSDGYYREEVIPSFRQQGRYQQIGYQRQGYQQQQYQQQQYHPQQYQSNVVYNQPRQQQYTIASYSSELPIDTPEVQQARAAHLAALAAAQSHHYRARRGIYQHSDVPQDTLEVQAAKYQHLLAHASVHDEDDDDYYPAQDHGLFHIPVITKKGVPVATAEVKAARQQHLRAHELTRAGVQYSGGHSVYTPVIAPNGIPYDTPEVYIAKAEHLAAHAQESTKHNQWGLVSGYGEGHGF